MLLNWKVNSILSVVFGFLFVQCRVVPSEGKVVHAVQHVFPFGVVGIINGDFLFLLQVNWLETAVVLLVCKHFVRYWKFLLC